MLGPWIDGLKDGVATMNLTGVKKVVLKGFTVINSANRAEVLAEAEASKCKGYFDEDDCSFSCKGKCQGAGIHCQMDFDLNESTGILEVSCTCATASGDGDK